MEQGGLPTADVAAAIVGFKGLGQRLTTLDEAGKRRLADIEPKLAGCSGGP
jgi:hypothetical protein